jgi:hypothetical protein
MLVPGRLPRRTVRFRVLAEERIVLSATVRTTAACRYRLQGRTFALAADSSAIPVETRFLGSASLTRAARRRTASS